MKRKVYKADHQRDYDPCRIRPCLGQSE
jgi:hypothetical protein